LCERGVFKSFSIALREKQRGFQAKIDMTMYASKT